jgi:hypothetical protein
MAFGRKLEGFCGGVWICKKYSISKMYISGIYELRCTVLGIFYLIQVWDFVAKVIEFSKFALHCVTAE